MSVSNRERELVLQRRMFRGDLGLFTETILKAFRDSSNSGQQGERSLGALLRKDLSELRDDLSNVFKLGLTKERQHPNASRDVSTETKSPEERSKENLTDWCSGPWEDQNVSNGVLDREGASVISLFRHRTRTEDTQEPSEGNLWNLKNLACYLTFDPNTANSELALTDGNRTATRVWAERNPVHHPEQFQSCPQVLCREGLLDSAYWEVEWSGGADVGVAYNSLSRAGVAENVLLGQNCLSWSLECCQGSYTPCHDRRRLRSASPRPFTQRVGVHLDREAESLSFYCVSHDSMTLLHTFNASFCEPLYAAFWVWSYGGSVKLRQVELDWERLQ